MNLRRTASSRHRKGDPVKIAELVELRNRLDPFVLSAAIDRKLTRIYRLANHRQSPRLVSRWN